MPTEKEYERYRNYLRGQNQALGMQGLPELQARQDGYLRGLVQELFPEEG